jgi:6-pyruvoyltetrahydropterin/6-carboxytetrahydropterin synthase
MAERYQVRVTKEQFIFCSGHFISYEGSRCERLHGHNYRVAVEVSGPLDENYYVFDFIALKNLVKSITDDLDHRMMLPLKNPLIQVKPSGGQVEVSYRERRWSFPQDDCVLLPIENTTAEQLACYLAGRLRHLLQEQYRFHPETLRVEVEESPGQSALYEM